MLNRDELPGVERSGASTAVLMTPSQRDARSRAGGVAPVALPVDPANLSERVRASLVGYAAFLKGG